MYIRSMMEYKKHRLINSLVRLREYDIPVVNGVLNSSVISLVVDLTF